MVAFEICKLLWCYNYYVFYSVGMSLLVQRFIHGRCDGNWYECFYSDSCVQETPIQIQRSAPRADSFYFEGADRKIVCLTRLGFKQLLSAQRTAEKMAALRAVVLSGSGRALLSTPKTIKTPTVGRYMNGVFITHPNCVYNNNLERKRCCRMSWHWANISPVTINGVTQGHSCS